MKEIKMNIEEILLKLTKAESSKRRAAIIEEALSRYNIFYYKDNYKRDNNNIFINTDNMNLKRDTVMFIAHYDSVNYNFDNVLDNLASVVNLINLSYMLRKNRNELKVNPVIVLTDEEEKVSFTDSGSRYLADRIKEGIFGKVLNVINLELTAVGSIVWSTDKIERLDSVIVTSPFNDSTILQKNGVSSVCIGLFDKTSMEQYSERRFCDIWSFCHSPSDSVSLCNFEDMRNLAERLYRYIITLE